MKGLVQNNDRFHGRDGFGRWEHALQAHCGAFHCEPPPGRAITAFSGQIIAPALDPTRVGARIISNSPHIHRDHHDIRHDDNDCFFLVHQSSGSARIEHGAQQSLLQPGDLVLLDATRPCDIRFQGMAGQLSLILPRHTVQRLASGRRLLLNRTLRADSGPGRIAGALVTELFESSSDTPEATEAMMDALLHLIRPLVSEDIRQHPSCAPRTQAQLLNRAQQVINDDLANPELSPALIARAMGCSLRTLHRLFAHEGITLGRYIMERRLERCAESLAQHVDQQKISAVAFDWGFSDLSHFSRAFKARYGQSPKDFRMAACN
ncbi:DNA-binding domain-containing protein, AraC-type [Pseudomonas asplenii]|uniref:DNA-binding domain-containing protein, AraC-type n=1 Tax=Pseudomonas asplenii TaxID=53407 RepID=A0A0N0E1N6_9PSED|nr:transcriptional regulator FeaR [Pseudomonas fuscovaginae]KPA87920.1 DNA-binding domain-containing protein, AraC-type [Pseudomonas fuscovaginae]